MALLLLSGASFAEVPPVYRPIDSDQVLARVPAGYAAWRNTDIRLSAESVAARLQEVARTGDTRLLGRLDRWLAGSTERPVPAHVALARAWVAQHRHDFESARREVAAVLVREPRAIGALSLRAHLNLTQGRLLDAQRDCAAMLLLDARQAGYCGARLAMRRGQLEPADRLLARLGEGSDAIAIDARLLRAEVFAARGSSDAETESIFRAALEASPGDVRALRAYSRWLRSRDRASEALALLPAASSHDGIALERALAASAAGSPDAAALGNALRSRHAAALEAGYEPELRDAAELALLAGDPEAALDLAKRNFETQRDAEDVDLLERAAAAAGEPAALERIAEWARREGAATIARG